MHHFFDEPISFRQISTSPYLLETHNFIRRRYLEPFFVENTQTALPDDISFEDHELAVQELYSQMQEVQDKHDKQIAKLTRRQDVEVTKRVAEAVAAALASKVSSTLRQSSFSALITHFKIIPE